MTAPRHSRPAAPLAAGPMPASADLSDPLRWVWLALVSGLFFIRWWQPTEGTIQGDTLPIAMGWFLALTLAGWVGLRGTGWRLRFDGWQWAVWLLVGGHIISALIIVCTSGDRRAALNLMWEWIAIGVSFPLLRSALTRSETRREWTIVALAAAVTLGGYGLTQRYLFYPQLVAQYDRLRQELDTLEKGAANGETANLARIQKLQNDLLSSGLSPNMLSGSGRAMFEGRLKHSTEALGQFALANTFAGLLLVWWIVLAALTWQRWLDYRAGGTASGSSLGQIVQVAGLAICVLVVGYCLLLTKSRTGFVGGVIGLGLCTLVGSKRWSASLRQGLLWGGIAILAIGGLVLAAGLTGGLDHKVIGEAPKSLQYRLEYWWSSLQVIRESPLTGVGPGQFRQHYLAHKLPYSSEEISDPHQLVLDVWANGGVIALAGLLWLAWLLIQQVLGISDPMVALPVMPNQVAAIPLAPTVRESGTPANRAQKIPQPKPAERNGNREADVTLIGLNGRTSPFRWGAVAGLASLWLVAGGLETLPLVLLMVWILMIWVMDYLLPIESLSAMAWAAVAVGLLVHLCGAGGIAMPAITQLLMLACVFVAEGLPSGRQVVLQTWQKSGLLASGMILFGLGYATAAQPAGYCRWFCNQGDFAQSPGARERNYRLASLSDPVDEQPWSRLGDLFFHKWQVSREHDNEDFEKAVAAQQQAIRRNPLSYQVHQSLGMFYAERAARTADPDDKMKAVSELQIAVKYYPHNAALLAEAARVFELGGNAELAKLTARQALEQDDINRSAGHQDKWLTEERRQDMKRLSAGTKQTGREA